MEVEAAARRVLIGDDPVNGYVVGKVYRYRLEAPLEGTSGRAIVVDRNNGWATPDQIKTQEYPILRVKCYADATRSGDGEIERGDAPDKAWALYRLVNARLHGRRGEWWGAVGSNPGLMVVSSARSKEPFLVTERDRHGVTAGDPLGDVVYVVAEYNLIVLH